MKGEFRYRLQYEKTDLVRYISHLDFVRVINRAIRRSGLPVTYTQGFNPHPVFKIAMPISVGVTSECEYMEIDLDENMDSQMIMDKFNSILPGGINIRKVLLQDGNLPDFNKITTACYRVCVEMTYANIPNIEAFMNLNEILILKKSKSKEQEVNIRPSIHHLSIEKTEGRFIDFIIEVSAGAAFNLKPELVIAAMKKYIEGFDYEFMQVHRLQLLSNSVQLI